MDGKRRRRRHDEPPDDRHRRSRKRRERSDTVRPFHRTTNAASSSHARSADGGTLLAGGEGGWGEGEARGSSSKFLLRDKIRDDDHDDDFRRRRRIRRGEEGEGERPKKTTTTSSSSSGAFIPLPRSSSHSQAPSNVPIVVVGSDVDANLVIEVRRAYLVDSLRRTLRDSCMSMGFVPPVYTWERWQSRSMLRELLFHPASSSAARSASVPSSSLSMETEIATAAAAAAVVVLPPSSTTPGTTTTRVVVVDEVLPCTGCVDDGCVSDLVRGGCDHDVAVAIATNLALAAANAASELREYARSLYASSQTPPPPRLSSADGGARRAVGVVVGGGGGGGDCGKNEEEEGDHIVGVGAGRNRNDEPRRVDDVRVDDEVGIGTGEVVSNRQRKRIELHRRRAMRGGRGDAAPGASVPERSRRRGQSFLEEEAAKHAVRVQSHRHSVDFSISSDGGRRLLKLNHAHYEKLRRLVTASCVGGRGGDVDSASSSSSLSSSRVGGPDVASPRDNAVVSESDFHKLVYCVLSRYRSVLGHGFQMALGEHAFVVLREWFDVRFECFASPLNCTCEDYASAFPLTDRYFGARGNFFTLRPKYGSFEANPPFIAEIMSAMVTHMHELLRDATGPMSFVVIVPGWLDDPAWAALTASSFKCAFFLVAAADHGFCDGAQHQRQDRFRESTYDTGVFVLQNSQGSKMWPVNRTTESATAALAPGEGYGIGSGSAHHGSSGIGGGDVRVSMPSGSDIRSNDISVEAPLRRAMARAIPTEMMKMRRLRDGRGHADLDGGGGVYKGKKANRKFGSGKKSDR